MARRTFDLIDVTEILTHWHAGRSLSEMSESLDVDRKTLRKSIAPAVGAGIARGGPAKSEEEWAELVRGWFPQLADTRLRQVTWPAIAVHRDYIVEQLEAAVTQATIWQRLRDEQGLAVSIASFRRYVAANVPDQPRLGRYRQHRHLHVGRPRRRTRSPHPRSRAVRPDPARRLIWPTQPVGYHL